MLEHILVPLDGSTRAEAALPIATRIARATGSSVVLLQVVSMPINYEYESGPDMNYGYGGGLGMSYGYNGTLGTSYGYNGTLVSNSLLTEQRVRNKAG